MKFTSPIAAALLLWVPLVYAQDQELYDPAPPPNAAFVRIVNASGTSIDARMESVQLDQIAYPSATAYHVVPAGNRALELDEHVTPLMVEAGRYYTVGVTRAEQGLTGNVVQDEVSSNPAKCGVLFYNFSDRPSATLHVPSRHVHVIGDLGPGQGRLREVNAIEVDMAVLAGGRKVQDFPVVQLKRRAHLSFVLTGVDDELQAFMVENSTVR